MQGKRAGQAASGQRSGGAARGQGERPAEHSRHKGDLFTPRFYGFGVRCANVGLRHIVSSWASISSFLDLQRPTRSIGLLRALCVGHKAGTPAHHNERDKSHAHSYPFRQEEMFARPPSPPRQATFSVASPGAQALVALGGGFSFVLLLLGTIFTFAGGPPWNDWILDYRGVRVQADAVEVRPTNTSHNDNDVFKIVLRVSDRRGKAHVVVVSTSDESKIKTARARGGLLVEYDPESPTRARFLGEKMSVFGLLGPVLGLLGALNLPLLFLGLWLGRRTMRVYRDGVAVEARVTLLEECITDDNGQMEYKFHYEFCSPSGVARGASRSYTPPPVGAQIWIVYDPRNPDRNLPSQE